MTITVTFTADSAEDLTRQIADYVGGAVPIGPRETFTVGTRVQLSQDEFDQRVSGQTSEPEPVTGENPVPEPETTEPPIMPSARTLAEAHGIDWRVMTGSGKGGKVTKGDVEKLVARNADAPAAEPTPEIVQELDAQGATDGSQAPTRDTVREAFEPVFEKLGALDGRAFLQDFGANRLSDIGEADFSRFIAACQAKVAGGAAVDLLS